MDFRITFRKIHLPSSKIRLRSPKREKLELLARQAENAQARADRIRRDVEPLLTRLFELRTRLATVGVALLAVWLFVHVVFGANGMIIYRSKRAEHQKLVEEIEQLKQENEEDTRQVNQLKTDPKRIEREAREQFHYARPGELIYVAPEPPASTPPNQHSAGK